jgi:putative membrane protein
MAALTLALMTQRGHAQAQQEPAPLGADEESVEARQDAAEERAEARQDLAEDRRDAFEENLDERQDAAEDFAEDRRESREQRMENRRELREESGELRSGRQGRIEGRAQDRGEPGYFEGSDEQPMGAAQRDQGRRGRQMGRDRDQMGRDRDQANRGMRSDRQRMNLDAQFLSDLHRSSRFEVELAQMVLDRTDSDQVRQFARTMVEDHNRAIDRVERFIEDHDVNVNLPRQLSEWQEAKLDHLSGLDPDTLGRKYIFHQVAAHHAEILEHEFIASETNNQELRRLACNMISTLQTHLRRADRLASNFVDESVLRTAGLGGIYGTPVSRDFSDEARFSDSVSGPFYSDSVISSGLPIESLESTAEGGYVIRR